MKFKWTDKNNKKFNIANKKQKSYCRLRQRVRVNPYPECGHIPDAEKVKVNPHPENGSEPKKDK